MAVGFPGKNNSHDGESKSEQITHHDTGWWLFFHILGIMIPFDVHIFQRGRSTTNHDRMMT